MDNIGEVLGPVFVLSVISYTIKMFLDYLLRKKLIDKGVVDENIKYLFSKGEHRSDLSAIKWGLLCISVGVALFAGTFMADRYYGDQTTVGLMFLLGGISLIAYYIIAGIVEKKERENS